MCYLVTLPMFTDVMNQEIYYGVIETDIVYCTSMSVIICTLYRHRLKNAVHTFYYMWEHIEQDMSVPWANRICVKKPHTQILNTDA
jgi:hypothetical protein